MNRYLLFRTDRIGDFLLSAVLINSIKQNDSQAHITVIASIKNFKYIQNSQLVDDVILLKNNILDKIKLFFFLNKNNYQNIIVHDNKNRSKIISFLLKSKKKIFITKFQDVSHFDIIKKILSKLNFTFNESSLNIFEKKIFNKFKFSDFIQFHFDEKWIHKDYIKKYINIEPSVVELLKFLNTIILKTNKRLIVTTGLIPPKTFDEIYSKNTNTNISFYKDLSFERLQDITINSNTLISCHGAISHVAASKNIKQIDIIDKSYLYSRWTSHFRNYIYVYRDKFEIMSEQILKKL